MTVGVGTPPTLHTWGNRGTERGSDLRFTVCVRESDPAIPALTQGRELELSWKRVTALVGGAHRTHPLTSQLFSLPRP